MNSPASPRQNIKVQGRGISPGRAVGTAFLIPEHAAATSVIYDIQQHELGSEFARIELAIERVMSDLQCCASRVERQMEADLAAVFLAHQAMLGDPTLLREMREEMEAELLNAEEVVARVFRRWERKFRALEQPGAPKPAEDMADLTRRLLREMTGLPAMNLEQMPAGSILVARRLLPSDAATLPRHSTAGIVVERGGTGSHAALLARAMGIPAVAQFPRVMQRIASGDTLIVDGDAGEVVVAPDETTLRAFNRKLEQDRQEITLMRQTCHEAARTLDGVTVEVMANAGCCDDVELARTLGADGIGLYRTEQFYLVQPQPPSEEDLFAELSAALSPLKGKPVTVRLLDLGGDKPPPFLSLPEETNPFLGRRGVRLLFEFPKLLETQLLTFLRLSQEHDLRILVPMVTVPNEMARVGEMLQKAATTVGVRKIPPLGAMIETPAAALSVAQIVKHAEFLSLGTNDLTQYTMAADRDNEMVSDLFIEDHPAVLRLARLVLGEAGQTPVDACGELAGRPAAIPVLLEMGIKMLSVTPPLVPKVKQTIRQTDTRRVQPGQSR